MFSTFTGNTRRPRNVNLSGAAGNPFSNTSWSPSTASNPTKAVTDAQAEREKRQADRQRLKAAGRIQRTWRGHKDRMQVSNARRASFDALYKSHDGVSHPPTERLPLAFNLLLAFFSSSRADDISRLLAFARDCESISIENIPPANTHQSRMTRFAQILVAGTEAAAEKAMNDEGKDRVHVFVLIELAGRLVTALPRTLAGCVYDYFAALSAVFAYQGLDSESVSSLSSSLSAPFRALSGSGKRSSVIVYLEVLTTVDIEEECYKAFAFRFLVRPRISTFESNIDLYAKEIDTRRLSNVIFEGNSGQADISSEDQLWQLAHLIAIGHHERSTRHISGFLDTLQAQLADLSSEISVRLGSSSEAPTNSPLAGGETRDSLDPYVSQQLMSLVSNDSLSRLVQELSAESSDRSAQGGRTGTLPGYISTLLLCFPTQADEVRMRLFLSTISTPDGEMPIFKYIWHDFSSSNIFNRLAGNFDHAVVAMRQYFHGTFEKTTESEWRVAVMFLELYIFVLRLSDDDDFFSAMNPLLDSARSPSRLQACSLALSDLKALTAFLKNTAFAMHYKTREISEALTSREKTNWPSTGEPPRERLRSETAGNSHTASRPQKSSAKLDYASLKNLVTTAIKMLYERDSRKQFLPSGHWLMTSSLEKETFINAVIAEELRRRQEEDEGSDIDSDEDEDMGVDRSSMYAKSERLRRKAREAQKQRRLAEMGPKLEILKHMPFVVPFDTRVKIFRQFIGTDRSYRAHGADNMPFELSNGFLTRSHRATIRRGYAFEDAYTEFYKLGEGLKDPLHITFQDQWGANEAGIDGGGVTKEFLTSVTDEALAQNNSTPSMFTSSYNGLLFPDPTAVDVVRESYRQHGISEMDSDCRAGIATLIKKYEFLGRIIGKCLYEGILIDIAFAGFFLLQWSSANADGAYKGSINDLRDIDEELYKGMLRLKDYPGDVSELDINFTINDQVSLPGEPVKTVTRNLIPNGDKVLVTNDNRLLYISYVARHRLVAQSASQTNAFLRGLREMIHPSWLSMFNQLELQRLVGGDSSEIDIDDLRRNTVYGGLYVIGDDNEEHPTIKLFWKVMRDFTDKERRDVIKYVSSTPRAPLLGFSQLTPQFSIRDSGTDDTRLPSTSTCVNLLKLPVYKTERVLREKLLYAVTSGAGFDLS